ncbi:MAG TPA: putative Ig domain-containing protein [Bryobacteraceae bacterium]
MNGKINPVLNAKRASAILLACAASLFTTPAWSAINGVSAPRLLLTCLDFQQNAETTVLTCKVTNVSSTSGGQAPVIQNLELLVGGSIVKMTPPTVSSGGPPSYSDAMTFPAGTYTKGTIFAVEGVAVDGIFGNTAGSPSGTQFVASNSVTVIDPTQPPQLYLPGNCTYEATLSSTPLNFPADGGNASIVVDTETDAVQFPSGCPWAPSTHNGAANVIQFTGHGAPQTGPGQAPFEALPNWVVNGSSNPRVIVMPETPATANAVDVIGPAVAGFAPSYHGSFQFSQDGLTCAYTASGFTVPQAGFSAANPGVVTITATGQTVPFDNPPPPAPPLKGNPDPNCEWQVTSSSSEVTIVGGNGVVHTGTGTFQYYVSANSGPAARIVQFSLGTLVFQTSQPGMQANVSVTLTTSPAGLSLVADGTTYAAPHTFEWGAGSQHVIGTTSPQGSGGTQYVFASWSQGGASSQTITVPTANATYTANFTTGYQLTTAVSPAGSGTVTPASGGYYAAGSTVNLAATAGAGYAFTGWTGPVSSSTSASTTIVMSAPQSVTAAFAPSNPTLACPAGNGTVGVPYSSHLTAGGGAPPYKFTITPGALPAGLTLAADTGAISGTPTAAGTSNFTAKVVDSKANSATASCAIAVIKITMDSLEVTEPATPNAVDGTAPAVTPVSSTNTSAAFAAAGSTDLVVVLLNSGMVTVKGVNIQPAGNAGQVQWQMDRDPTDKIDLSTAPGCAASPSGAPAVAGSPGAAVTFSPSTPGNFRLAAYIDANANGKFDDGEQLRILRVAIVRATLMNAATSTFRTTNDFVPDAPAGGKAGVDAKGPAMRLLGDYMIEGGGGTCTVGAAQITIGDVGNLFADTFVVNYPVPNPPPPAPGNVAGTAAENPGGPLPMVDTGRVAKGNQPGGGVQAFRTASKETPKASATGRRIGLSSNDSPGYGFWKIDHPTTTNLWGSTTGGNQFREFVVGFSSSFSRTYSPLNENNWTVAVSGKNDGTGKWKDNGASVTGNDTKLTAVAHSVQVQGLSFVNEFSYVCVPAPPAGVSCN